MLYINKKVPLALDFNERTTMFNIIKFHYCIYNDGLRLLSEIVTKAGIVPSYRGFIRSFEDSGKNANYIKKFSREHLICALSEVYNDYENVDVRFEENLKFKSLTKRTSYRISIDKFPRIAVERDRIFISGFMSKEKTSEKNWIRLAQRNRISEYMRMIKPFIYFDGENYYIEFAIEPGIREILTPRTDGIGIDVGIKTLCTLNTGEKFENVITFDKFQNALRRRDKLRSQIDTLRNGMKERLQTEDPVALTSCQVSKLEKQLRRLNRHITNMRDTYLHEVTSSIIKRNPLFIGIETLNVENMVNSETTAFNKRLYLTSLQKFLDMIEYKARLYSIPLIKLEKDFPSSKKCCSCGKVKKTLNLQTRTYSCDECGWKIDRDVNAAVNIYKYALRVFRSKRRGITVPLECYYTNKYRSWRGKIADTDFRA